jgi:rhodanese-related sulfurtransferase
VVQNLTPQQLNELLSKGDIDVVDVRDPSEWSSGHLHGARLVPLEHFRKNAKSSLPRDGVVFVCAAGVRSQTAARTAAALGLTKVYSLIGGTRNWVKAGFSLASELGVAV